jgi:spore germination cell wall hydrolase CwlJ-like protein
MYRAHQERLAEERRAEELKGLSQPPQPELYKTNSQHTFSLDELLCLARNIYFEAATESDLGKYAVAQVTLNRMQHQRWPDTVCKVVYQPSQFSWTLDDKRRFHTPKSDNKTWQRCVHIAYDVLYNGTRLTTLEESYFYHAVYVKPQWSQEKQLITRIDMHVFYRARGG